MSLNTSVAPAAVTFRSTITATLDTETVAGSDAKICKAARVSTVGAAAAETGEARGLINYLMKNRHGSPFEHAQLSFLVEAPIFVAREFMRHRVGWSYNETSGRYRELEPVFYMPPASRPLVQVGKAGEYSFEHGTHEQYDAVEHSFGVIYRAAYSHYQQMLGRGVAREVARSVLPVGTFTSFYATCNPRSLMHFLSLRTTSAWATFPSFPQEEIERVADDMEKAFSLHFPLTWEAYLDNGRVCP
ncbi:thymidylate synthase (FAD) [Streptomyces sp. BK022]|uniref:FAD-dependent thymidylate synthase n=1 Tax=Streptomyces sp. BK022 TaxID=2512123 RepID=UPI00102A0E94|nr:FAD-dependent thymidylate synthase [Streptomyces sp. BK022]RZU35974.1 thymidylate synthase (FAD) [Streptomyces sp. BK022]